MLKVPWKASCPFEGPKPELKGSVTVQNLKGRVTLLKLKSRVTLLKITGICIRQGRVGSKTSTA